MSLLISLSALLVSVIFIQLGTGSLGPLDALSGVEHGFTPGQIGLLGSSHYLGLLIGCFVYPWLIRNSGHARAFGMAASASAISTLLHPVFVDVGFWCALRVLSGFSVAGAFAIIESWLNAKVANENRGKLFGAYRVVDMSGTMLAQGMIALLDPATYAAYNIVAMFACISLLPLALTRAVPPELPKSARLRPFFAFALSPLASIGVLVSSMSTASLRMVGPLYASEIGLDTTNIAIFLVLAVLGGALMQIPAGYIVDRFDRRLILIIFALGATAISLITGFLSLAGALTVASGFIFIFLFSMAIMPIYSICATHANDFAKIEDLVALSASLLFLFAAGAIAGPLVSGYLIQYYNAGAMFVFIGLVNVLLVLYALWRMTIRPALNISSYSHIPSTSAFINVILRNRGSRDMEDL